MRAAVHKTLVAERVGKNEMRQFGLIAPDALVDQLVEQPRLPADRGIDDFPAADNERRLPDETAVNHAAPSDARKPWNDGHGRSFAPRARCARSSRSMALLFLTRQRVNDPKQGPPAAY